VRGAAGADGRNRWKLILGPELKKHYKSVSTRGETDRVLRKKKAPTVENYAEMYRVSGEKRKN